MRYAIYFTPEPDDPLTQDAAAWLGRDPHDGSYSEPDHAFAHLAADPARYGFHATMKAPFALKPDATVDDLVNAVSQFCAERGAVVIPQLVIERLGPFFALVPGEPCAPLDALAAQTVLEFERFRAPLTDDDIARRKPDKLTEEQRSMLLEWGYPYVFSEFRFHMTLTGPVPDSEAETVHAELERRFARHLAGPLVIDALSIFHEPERGTPFTVAHRAPLSFSPQLEPAQP